MTSTPKYFSALFRDRRQTHFGFFTNRLRSISLNCSTNIWNQQFSYDPFGNITKTVRTVAQESLLIQVIPTATNHYTSLPGLSYVLGTRHSTSSRTRRTSMYNGSFDSLKPDSARKRPIRLWIHSLGKLLPLHLLTAGQLEGTDPRTP